MINLRYHIVSLTAVFLAIGIGLTLGSTFLDRATVENLNGQLRSLEQRLGERDEHIGELESELDQAQALQEALDEQGVGLLADRLDPVPVLVVASEGVDEEDLEGAIGSLQVAGADVQGLWRLSERLLLTSDADVSDLATALDETSTDPARLRRVAIDALGEAIQERQAEGLPLPAEETAADDAGAPPEAPVAEPGAGGAAGEAPPADGAANAEGDGATDGEADAEGDATAEAPAVEELADAGSLDPYADVQALIDAGFIVFEPAAGGPEAPTLPPGVRVVLVGGSASVPDDVIVGPLLDRLAEGATEPIPTVVTSALGDAAQVSEVVAAVRGDDRLRGLVSTVDDIDRFPGWMATVLVIEDLADDVVGHYGLGDGASSLLPPLQAP